MIERDPRDGEMPWQLLVQVLDPGRDLDRTDAGAGLLQAAPHDRLERLLRATGVPAGLLFNGRVLRLVSAPRGESSGWMDFRVADMHPTAGRPLCAALRLLLGEPRLLTLPRAERLAALLASSRAYQNEVSELLAEQVLHALYELLRGFQAADDMRTAPCCGRRGPTTRTRSTAPCSPWCCGSSSCCTPRNATCCRRTTRRLRTATPSPGCTSVCARMRRCTPTRWTSASAPGRSSWRCSAWSTTARDRAPCCFPHVRASCSTPTASSSWRPAAGARTPDPRTGRAPARRRRHGLPRAGEAPRPGR